MHSAKLIQRQKIIKKFEFYASRNRRSSLQKFGVSLKYARWKFAQVG